MSDDDLETYESQIEYSHFVRMLRATTYQPEYRVTGGALIWFVVYQLRWLLYHQWANRLKPFLFTVERQGAVLGGIMVGPAGEVGQPVVTLDPLLKPLVLRLIANRLDKLFAESKKKLFFRTFESNTSIIRAGLRRGFVLTQAKEYVITLPLGIFTVSWIAKRPPSYFKPLFTVRTLRLLERGPGNSSTS